MLEPRNASCSMQNRPVIQLMLKHRDGETTTSHGNPTPTNPHFQGLEIEEENIHKCGAKCTER